MTLRKFLALLLSFLLLATLAVPAQAHIGSPDVFYDGTIGPYPARVTIRMPDVVPGRAQIAVHVDSNDPVHVSFLPLYTATHSKNAPPPDAGRLVEGETNLYAGELWLMSFGAYSVEIRIRGPKGEGLAQIPVTSAAVRQLPMPSILGKILVFLAGVLVIGGIGIAAASGRESTLLPGARPGKSETRKSILAASITAIVFALALSGGWRWWQFEERQFRNHLREGGWPDLTATTRIDGPDRILRLEVGPRTFHGKHQPALIPDHGKLMHLFLIREGTLDAFAHLHPVRKSRYTFDVALPPLPEGRYTIYTDLTLEGGASSTATTSISLPAIAATTPQASTSLTPANASSALDNTSPTSPAQDNALLASTQSATPTPSTSPALNATETTSSTPPATSALTSTEAAKSTSPAPGAAATPHPKPEPETPRDPDDSWATLPASAVPAIGEAQPIYRLPSGQQIVWKTQHPPRVGEDASLRFELLDATGTPLPLDPYMGMLSHAAILRRDGTIFAHLHPAGNFSMAAQTFFETKLARESTPTTPASEPQPPNTYPTTPPEHHHHTPSGPAASSVYLPYQFPEPGPYRIWVQLKSQNQILTAAFDIQVIN